MSKWDKLVVSRAEAAGRTVAVYRFSGNLTSGTESYAFLDTIYAETRKKNPIKVVINLEEVEHVTSAGVGILAACYTSIKNAGGTLCLTGMNNRVRVILNVVRFLDIVPSAPNEDEAIRIASHGHA